MSSTLVRAARALLAIVAVAGPSCVAGHHPPKVVATRQLAPSAGGADGAAAPPFAVAFATPEGEHDVATELTVTWNRPMRALDLAGDEAPPPVHLTPDVPGRWQWVGTQAVTFVPATHLPFGSELRLEVPAGTRALDGSALGVAFSRTLTTPPPSLVRVTPSEGERQLAPGATFELRFDQPITDAELARAVTLDAGEKPAQRVAFDVRRPDPQNPARALLVPRTPLPRASAVKLRLDPSLRGAEGPRPAGRERVIAFRTWGPPGLVRLSCDRDTPHRDCSTFDSVVLQLATDVKLADLRRALVIEPAVAIESPAADDGQITTEVYLRARFAPGRTYRITLRAGLRDAHGQALARDASVEATFDHAWPDASFTLSGQYLEPGRPRTVAVASRNVPDLSLTAARLDDDAVADLAALTHELDAPFLSRLAGARTWSAHPTGRTDAALSTPLALGEWLGGDAGRGAVGVVVGFTARPGTKEQRQATRARVVQSTDLALTAKLARDGVLVWVTQLSSGAPVAGAEVELRRAKAAFGPVTTDADGLAWVPGFELARWGDDPGVVIARSKGDRVFRNARDLLETWRFGASADLSRSTRAVGMLFTDRGVYRPGDTVRVKGIFRRPDARGLATPRGAKVTLACSDPDGDAVSTRDVATSDFGTFDADVRVPATAKLGTFRLEAKLDGAEQAEADLDFELAEYHPAELRVAVEADRKAYVRGDDARVTTRADYLYGAPVALARTHVTVGRASTSFAPPGAEGFTFDDEARVTDDSSVAPRAETLERADVALDAKGTLTRKVALALDAMRGPERVTFESEVQDLTRRAVAGRVSVLVHPAEFYVGLALPGERFVDATRAFAPRVLAVEPDGARRERVPVHLDLVRRTWTIARADAGGGEVRTESRAIDAVVASCDVGTAHEPAGCSLTPPAPGYYLVRATAKDAAGRAVASSLGLYALGAGEVTWGEDDSQKLELVADRASYKVGQTARILVRSPFARAEALVTVERAGIFTRRRVTLTGTAPVLEVPITDELRPNAFVSVVLVRGRTKAPPAPGKPDVGAPTFRMGLTQLVVDPESRRLAVRVMPSRTELAPGAEVDVDVDVLDRDGKPARAEVTLYAVDEGVLALTGERTPDPIPVFGAPRPLEVATLESRTDLAKLLGSASAGLDKGLDGGGGGSARRDFRQTAFFAPALPTDAKGRAHARFKLPDALTTYRVMAVAVAEDDRFGSGDARVTTHKPLMARPSLPRFWRAGDTAEAGVVVASRGLAATRVEVEAKVDGLALDGDAKRTLELPRDGSAEVRFTLRAERVGQARLRFLVHGGGASAAVELTRDVAAPIAPESVALAGDTRSAAGESLGELGAIRDDVGGLDVTLASSALGGLAAGVEQLVAYPYGCTEQLTSRLVPLLALRDLARSQAIALPADVDAAAATTVGKLLANQRGDGGFGWWPDAPASSPWVSAWALWALDLASHRGISVPASALARSTTYVRRSLDDATHDGVSLATAAFVVDVLAGAGAPDAGATTRLFERRADLPVFARALLAHAMVAGHAPVEDVQALVADLAARVRLEGPLARAVTNEGDAYAVLLDSDARTSALVLRALVAAEPRHALGAPLARGLLADRRGGRWRSTHETAWALLALDDYRRAQEPTAPDLDARAFVGDLELLDASMHGEGAHVVHASVPAAALARASGSVLAFTATGEGHLFYEARLRYARRELPRAPLDRGFFVRRTLRATAPDGLPALLAATGAFDSVAEARAGDLVVGEITVVTPSPRAQVVIDDPLPAGLEPEDLRLATTARRASPEGAESDQADPSDDDVAAGRAVVPTWFRRELRDDRVLFFVEAMPAGIHRYRWVARATSIGTFVAPPTRAEAMYAPEVFGRTAATTLRVRAVDP